MALRLAAAVLAVLQLQLRTTAAQGECIVTIAGTGTAGLSGNSGQALQAMLNTPRGVLPMRDGSILIADANNNVVRRIATDGIITTWAGTGTAGFSGDGGQATSAQLNGPVYLALTGDGNSVLISDRGNNRIRRRWPDGTITTVAGTGTSGASGDGGPATVATIGSPWGVAGSADGGFWISDGTFRVRRVLADGTMTTAAGTGLSGASPETGFGPNVTVWSPMGIFEAPDGSAIFAASFNWRVRRLWPNGTLSTLAGSGASSYSGDGGPALLAGLWGVRDVAYDPWGNLWLVDNSASRLRRVNTQGLIESMAGTGVVGYSGDNITFASTAAQLSSPNRWAPGGSPGGGSCGPADARCTACCACSWDL
jgi:hypothetical protein